MNLMYPTSDDPELITNKTDYVKKLTEKFKLIYESHLSNQQQDKLRMKQFHDKNVRICRFRIGNIVWKADESSQGLPRRFQRRFLGPFCIEAFLDEGYTCLVKNLTNGKVLRNKIHVNLLKLYTTPLTEEEKKHLRTENVTETEFFPTRKSLLMTDVETETDPYDPSTSFPDLKDLDPLREGTMPHITNIPVLKTPETRLEIKFAPPASSIPQASSLKNTSQIPLEPARPHPDLSPAPLSPIPAIGGPPSNQVKIQKNKVDRRLTNK